MTPNHLPLIVCSAQAAAAAAAAAPPPVALPRLQVIRRLRILGQPATMFGEVRGGAGDGGKGV